MIMGHCFNYRRDPCDDRDLKFSGMMTPHPSVKLPLSVDLRKKCPPVYDQGDLGSCTANAGVACRVMLMENPGLELSRLFLYYVIRRQEGMENIDSGGSMRDTCKTLHKTGVCEEKFMPYDVEKFTRAPSPQAVANAEKYKVHGYRSLNSLNEIKYNLSLRQQPVLMGMEVFESFESEKVKRTGIMPMPRVDEQSLGGHAVLVVGYMDNPDRYSLLGSNKPAGYLIVRNSWGADWGDKGYFYMPYEYTAKGNTFDYWVLEN
jgi:C1A family cysteine protease